MGTLNVKVKLLDEDARMPLRAHETDSGFDLHANEDIEIFPGETLVISTGVALSLPEGTEAQVRPRSGVTSRTALRVHLGTIDNGYTGEIGVIVENINRVVTFKDVLVTEDSVEYVDSSYADDTLGYEVMTGTYHIRKGDRIAQLVVQELPKVTLKIEPLVSTESKRGNKGFGSTGI